MIYRLLRKAFFQMDAESVHHLALSLLSSRYFPLLIPQSFRLSGPLLTRKLWGLSFPNPIGLAAGFDKNAAALLAWERLGFGHVELGTITRHPQPGNPRPRIFRIPSHQALINRMGFPNHGAEAIARRLAHTKACGGWPSIPIGINLGKSKCTPLEEAHEDYAFSFRVLREFADYFVINVSSPNTPGLRSLQGRDQLEKILGAVQTDNHRGSESWLKPKPLLVKIAPDLTFEQIAEVLEVMKIHACDGIVATNTTLDKSSVPLQEEGGLSGRPLTRRSTEIIREIAQLTEGKMPIIGVGGVFTAEDARDKIIAGASLIQSYTGFIYEGPQFAPNLCRALMQNGL